MRNGCRWMLGAALAGLVGCGDSGTGPAGDSEGARLASRFQRLADSVDDAGYSPTAEALRHAAEITRLTGHATEVTLTIDGTNRRFLAVAEQLDFPDIQCVWPADSGVAPPGDTVVVEPADSGSDTSDASTGAMLDSVPNPETPRPPECTRVGTFSMRTLIAWEPDRMSEVVRIVADAGRNDVEAGVPDVMTGLPPKVGEANPTEPASPPAPSDSGGGGGWGGYPGFMGEYLVSNEGTGFAVEGRQANSLKGSGGPCTDARASFDWAEFSCEAARFRFEFSMRVEPDHTLAMAASVVDGVRLSVVAWNPPLPPPGPPGPPPFGPPPSDSTITGR